MLQVTDFVLCWTDNKFQNLTRKYSPANPALFRILVTVINENSPRKAERSVPISRWSVTGMQYPHSWPSALLVSFNSFVQVPPHLIVSSSTLDLSTDWGPEAPRQNRSLPTPLLLGKLCKVWHFEELQLQKSEHWSLPFPSSLWSVPVGNTRLILVTLLSG